MDTTTKPKKYFRFPAHCSRANVYTVLCNESSYKDDSMSEPGNCTYPRENVAADPD